MAFSFQVRFYVGGSREAREASAGGVLTPPDWAGLPPNDRREQPKLPELKTARR